MSPRKPARCKARTKAGKQCQNRSLPGSDRCRRHVETVKSDKGDPAGPMGANEKALMTTLEAAGPPEGTDAARYQMLISLSRAVDAAPTRAALWEQYRSALAEWMKDLNDADRSLEDAVEALRRAAEMGDTKNR